MASTLYARLVGDFRLTDQGGRDCTPRSVKARALIGLLALTPGHRRSRRWIEGKLWSDRGPEQASGSLRQTLMELRTALGNAADALAADREQIGLTGLETDVGLDPEAARAEIGAGHDLLAGIDLRDPAYRLWLAEQRQRLTGGVLPTDILTGSTLLTAPVVAIPMVIQTNPVAQGFGGFVSLALADGIGRLVSEFALVDVFGPHGATVQLGPKDRGLILRIITAEKDERLHVMATLIASQTGQSIWSRRTSLPLSDPSVINGGLAAGEFPAMVFDAAEAALRALPRIIADDKTTLRTEAMMSRAVQDIFTFDARRLRMADALLRDAIAIAPSPRAYAWRGFLRQIMIIERTEPNLPLITDEAAHFARRAMEAAPTNGLVLALVAQLEIMVNGNIEAGSALARDALASNPNNPFAYSAMTGSLMRLNRPTEALDAARTGVDMVVRSGFRQWWDLMAGLAALSLGNFTEATAHLESAHARAPQFRPPLRNLLYLYLTSGQTEKAVRVLADLRGLEPDFSMRRVRDDLTYPAATLRQQGLSVLSLPDDR